MSRASASLAAREHVARLGFARRARLDAEVIAVLQGGDEAAGKHAFVRYPHGGGQVLGVGVDGETEQHQLHHRNAHQHAEGEAVAPHLDELLHHHCGEAGERERVHRA
jgi:hypothetical protein